MQPITGFQVCSVHSILLCVLIRQCYVLRNLEIEMLEVGRRHAFLDSQDLDTDNLVVGVKIENDTRLSLHY